MISSPPTRPVRPAAMKTGRGDLQKATPPEIQGHPKPRKGGSAPFGTPGRGLAHALCAPTLRKFGGMERPLDGQLPDFEKALTPGTSP